MADDGGGMVVKLIGSRFREPLVTGNVNLQNDLMCNFTVYLCRVSKKSRSSEYTASRS